MNLRKNIAVSYASQAYVALVGIVVVPLYIKYMGPEAYGLVGFYAMLQAWFMLLDVGLTPTMSRQTARWRGGALGSADYLALYRALRIMFVGIAVAGAGALIAGSGAISHHWLKVQTLPIADVMYALRVMALIVALRWIAGLYRGIVTGTEELVWLGKYNVIAASAKSLGVLVPLSCLGGTPRIFFTYQLVIATAEFSTLLVKATKLLPRADPSSAPASYREVVVPTIKFSITIAATSALWTFVTQSDKFILSNALSLSDYGYFTLAVLVASGITVVGGPVGNALMPRLAKLDAEGNTEALLRAYRRTTQLVATITISVAATVATFAHPLLALWTGNTTLADKAAPILIPYALGNALMALSAFPYYLQYARGSLRLHVIGSSLFVACIVPSTVILAPRFGGSGAGYVWLVTNAAYFLFYTPIVHARHYKRLHAAWLRYDIMPQMLVVAGACGAAHFLTIPTERLAAAGTILITGALIACLALLSSSDLRRLAIQIITLFVRQKKLRLSAENLDNVP